MYFLTKNIEKYFYIIYSVTYLFLSKWINNSENKQLFK